MKRREMLKLAGASLLGVSAFPLRLAGAAEKQHKILYFTRSAGFQHRPVTRMTKKKSEEMAKKEKWSPQMMRYLPDEKYSFSEKLLMEKGKEHGTEVVCTKDGTVFDGDIDQFDCIAFYTAGDLCAAKSLDGAPPISPAGKKKLLDAIAAGKSFVGFHSATDSFHSKGPSRENQKVLDPYIAMLGGEFIVHGSQQKATMKVVSPHFPGLDGTQDFAILEEWYTLKNFAKDLHVILVQETKGMKISGPDACYNRPPFPATWARMHGKGRVFYTSLGHREDVWVNPTCQKIVEGGFAWALHEAEADIAPNLAQVAPHSDQLKY